MLYIANQIDTNIRELEGALIRVVAYSSLINKDINADLAAEALKDIIPSSKPKAITVLDIQKQSVPNLMSGWRTSKQKKDEINRFSKADSHVPFQGTDRPLPAEDREEFGGRDHTTVIHAYEKYQK